MQHYNNTNNSIPYRATPENVAISAVLGLCFGLGIPGNLAVLVVVGQRLKNGNFTLKVMFSLAISDLLTLLSLPLWIKALLHGWIFGLVLCKMISYLVYWGIYSSVLGVTLLSVHRYLQVLYSRKWSKLGRKGELMLLIGVWILSGVLSSYSLFQRQVTFQDRDKLLHCDMKYKDDGERVRILVLETVSLFVVPFSILAFSYFTLNRKVSHMVLFRSKRMTKLVARIVLVFFLLWIPVHINNVLMIAAALRKSDRLLSFTKILAGLFGALTFINSCVNPFLYAFSAQVLRRQTPMGEST
ncbi:leukotriene B4 receptor 1-like [Chanos chanos]|uniref:Leukotriene B4 receptor 1-like n=1 Tax=Chanos chanos TaxID=29144 RepID=A0A6J2WUD1_CHACN|nr:leukotriene B4 receptor 1-like [Chanos chanos]